MKNSKGVSCCDVGTCLFVVIEALRLYRLATVVKIHIPTPYGLKIFMILIYMLNLQN